jgi:predicted secreted Zn-dependent protease
MLWALAGGLVACGSDETVLSISASAAATPGPVSTIAAPTLAPTATPVTITTAPATATPIPSPTLLQTATPTPRPANSPTAGPSATVPLTSTIAPDQSLKVTVRSVYYQIDGANADQLRAQLDKLGPLDESGQHFAAKTDGNLSWTWSYSEGGGQCSLHDISAELEIIFTLPRWTPPAEAPADLVDKWNKFTAALQVHENGHKEINIKAASDFVANAKTLPAYPTCDELKQALNKAGQGVIDRTRQENIAYDNQTQHGRTQGAVFP